MCLPVNTAGAIPEISAVRILPARILPARNPKILTRWRRKRMRRTPGSAFRGRPRADGFAEVLLHAQQEVIPFYERLGYRGEGEIFEEAGIPHLAMRKPV